MGYSERVCMLCGISFNIGRIRKPGEPESDAWNHTGTKGSFCIEEDLDPELKDDPDCHSIQRDENSLEREHIAGRNCRVTYGGGYSGWRIGADEMRERTWLQCLHRKDADWVPEPDDEPFETAARFCFVTGISKAGVGEWEADGFEPVKHGVYECDISKINDPEDEPHALPMHPTCFQMFKRMSVQRSGAVDIDGLWQLRKAYSSFDSTRFEGFEDRTDVRLVLWQYYRAIPGTEYLASHPVDVPQLRQLIADCVVGSGDVVFQTLPHKEPVRDPFQSLSPELRAMLLDFLGPKDVANLRLSSKSFTQLPQTFFKNLIRREMPWVWELEDNMGEDKNSGGIDWFVLWTKLSASDGGDCSDEKKRGEMDWGEVYETLCEGKETEIKGLRNRRMVYHDISMILDRTESLTPEQREAD